MTRRHPRATLYFLVLFALVPLASCQKPFHDKEERYAFVATNVSLPYWQEAKAGFMESAHVLGVKGEFSGPSTYAPDEELKYHWKVQRDVAKRGYTDGEVAAELARREPESAAYIRPQRAYADIVVRFAPIEERGETPHDPLSAYVMLRPTIAHPDLSGVISEDTRKAAHLKLMRDEDGKPVDALHVHAYAERSLTDRVERALWHALQEPEPLPGGLGRIGPEGRSEPLAVVQLLLLYHLFQARGGGEARPPEPALRPPTFHEPPGREEQDPGAARLHPVHA